MPSDSDRKSAALPVIFLLLVLINLGLAAWWWSQRQARASGYNAAAINLASPPKEDPSPAPAAISLPSRGPAPMADPARNFIPDPELSFQGRSPASRGTAPGSSAVPAGAAAKASESARPQTRQLVAAASVEYFRLKKAENFKSSPAIQEWVREFRAYPDLRAIDDRYSRDKDGVRFLVSMVRSPNFQTLLDRHFAAPDIQAFVKTLSSSPVVMATARNFFADFNMPAALRRYASASSSSGPAPAPPPRGSDAVEKIKRNPSLQKYLERQGGQGVPIGE